MDRRNLGHWHVRGWFLRTVGCAILGLCLGLGGGVSLVSAASFALPTSNHYLFSGKEQSFYQYTIRNFEGTRSYPWSGGKFGFSRNPKRLSSGNIAFARFHEGIDIRPLRRNSAGVPLDSVKSTAPGTVVYANHTSHHSSYGKYVVVRHDLSDGPVYSLYAHLQSISVRPGQVVSTGTRLGTLGWTGRGLNQTRAHLHFELNLLLHRRFPSWHDQHARGSNHHGVYNGINLVGLDVTSLLTRSKRGENISIATFVRGMSPYYKVQVPNTGGMELVKRYPWMVSGASSQTRASSWMITFSASGVPLRVEPRSQSVKTPVIRWVRSSGLPHSWRTRNRLTGSGRTAGFSSSGLAYVKLVAGDF